jgi:hypothetical protein
MLGGLKKKAAAGKSVAAAFFSCHFPLSQKNSCLKTLTSRVRA